MSFGFWRFSVPVSYFPSLLVCLTDISILLLDLGIKTSCVPLISLLEDGEVFQREQVRKGRSRL